MDKSQPLPKRFKVVAFPSLQGMLPAAGDASWTEHCKVEVLRPCQCQNLGHAKIRFAERTVLRRELYSARRNPGTPLPLKPNLCEMHADMVLQKIPVDVV